MAEDLVPDGGFNGEGLLWRQRRQLLEWNRRVAGVGWSGIDDGGWLESDGVESMTVDFAFLGREKEKKPLRSSVERECILRENNPL
uniref:Uncharacterized protein n=1 Tax=Cucumis melo TaxID=3656 RepID=A0A9I9CVA8_CUCME